MLVGGVIPEFNFTALPTQLVALSLTLSVYLSVFAALRTTKHYSPSHMCPPTSFFFLSAEFKEGPVRTKEA